MSGATFRSNFNEFNIDILAAFVMGNDQIASRKVEDAELLVVIGSDAEVMIADDDRWLGIGEGDRLDSGGLVATGVIDGVDSLKEIRTISINEGVFISDVEVSSIAIVSGGGSSEIVFVDVLATLEGFVAGNIQPWWVKV
jgi:hypothetical protein